MQEIELKFQIPEDALAAVRAEFTRLNAGQNTDLRLRASYFDTPDRHLAAARMALRVRQEGDDWVQTLKAGGSNTMMRLEDNQPAQAPAHGQPIRADLGRHAGTPAQEALERVLNWSMAQDPQGRDTGLIELYGTDITRTRALVTVGKGTLFEGQVELALDLGQIHSGSLNVPVRELEIESVSGHPMAVILAGRDWVNRHGLWLDTQTKAHRGDRLAREAAALHGSAGASDPSAATEHTTLARPAKLKPNSTMDEAWRAGIETCLEHITGNLSELGNAPASTSALAYQLRLGLRRLRALGRLWAHTPWALPASSLGKATTLARQLGYWRDQEALAWLPEKLRAAGGPALPLPSPTPPPDLPLNVVALARSALATELCLDVLAALLGPERPADASHPDLLPWLNARLTRWAARCARHAHGLAQLPDAELHQLRKRGKRLRLAAAIYAPLWPDKAFRRHDRALRNALTSLGRVQDEVVAQAWYAQLVQQEPQAVFACEWLQGRRKSLRKKAQRAAHRWLKRSSPW